MAFRQDDLERVGQILTKQYGLAVKCQGARAYTDGKTVWLPEITEATEESTITKMRMFLDHECGHVVGKSELALIDEAKAVHGWAGHAILNAVEDRRVEQLMSDLWAGAGLNISGGAGLVLAEVDREAVDPSVPEDRRLALNHPLKQFTIAIYAHGRYPMPKLVEQRVADVVAKYGTRLAEIQKSAKTTEEIFPLALELMREYKLLRAEEQQQSVAQDAADQISQQPDASPEPGQQEQADGTGDSSSTMDAGAEPPTEQAQAGTDDGEGEEGGEEQGTDPLADTEGNDDDEHDDAEPEKEDGTGGDDSMEEGAAEDAPSGMDADEAGDEAEHDDTEGDADAGGDEGDGAEDEANAAVGEDSSGDDEAAEAGSEDAGEGDDAGADAGEFNSGDDDGEGDNEGDEGQGGDEGGEGDRDESASGVDEDGASDEADGGGSGGDGAGYGGASELDTDAVDMNEMRVDDIASEVAKEISDARRAERDRSPVEAYRPYSKDLDLVVPLPMPTLYPKSDRTGPAQKQRRELRNAEREIDKAGGAMRQKLIQMLLSEAKVGWKRNLSRGMPDPRNLHKLAARTSNRVLRRPTMDVGFDTACLLLVDGSGSMLGSFARHAAVAAATFAEVLDVAGHACMLTTFMDRRYASRGSIEETLSSDDRVSALQAGIRIEGVVLLVAKDWAEPFKSVLPKIPLMGNLSSGGTPMGEAMEIAGRLLAKRPEKRRVLMVFGDGDPNGLFSGIDGAEYCRGVAQKLEKSGIEVAMIGIRTDAMQDIWHKSATVRDLDTLASVTMKELAHALHKTR